MGLHAMQRPRTPEDSRLAFTEMPVRLCERLRMCALAHLRSLPLSRRDPGAISREPLAIAEWCHDGDSSANAQRRQCAKELLTFFCALAHLRSRRSRKRDRREAAHNAALALEPYLDAAVVRAFFSRGAAPACSSAFATSSRLRQASRACPLEWLETSDSRVMPFTGYTCSSSR